MDYDLARCGRRCVLSGRELRDGEWVYSVVREEAGELRRQDIAFEAWHGPPEGTVAWWKTRCANHDPRPAAHPPRDALLRMLLELPAGTQDDLRYVLALLLLRKKVLRHEEGLGEESPEVLRLYAPREDLSLEVQVVLPTAERVAEIEVQLAAWLEAPAA